LGIFQICTHRENRLRAIPSRTVAEKQAGIDPKDIDAVGMSHAHIDHLGVNVGDDGKSNFPNAQF
jgi:glyoxylase-like metal-dependent hydrolase (beta-lactamase superfamily II)